MFFSVAQNRWKKVDSHENSAETILSAPYGFFADVFVPSKNFPRVSQNDFYVAFATRLLAKLIF
jgi:hypothetical protein